MTARAKPKTKRRKRKAEVIPRRFTPELRAQVVAHIGNGVSKDDAARAVGVGSSTFYAWQARSPEFAKEIRAAEDVLKPKLIGIITGAALSGDWRAAFAMLRAKWPDEFAPPTRVQHSGNPADATPIPIDAGAEMRTIAIKLAALSTEELRALAPVRRPAAEA